MADAAGAPGAVAGTPEGDAAPNGAPPPGKPETPAQKAVRLKLDLGDGEREYDPEHVKGLAQRGKKAAQTLSLAEKRAQEALKREQDTEGRLSRLKSKDLREVRAAMKELGLDERLLANDVGRDLLEDMELEKDPLKKELRDAKRALAEKERAEEEAKAKAEETKLSQAAEHHKEELSTLFLDVMNRAKLPKTSAQEVFPRLARLYQAADASGATVDPDLAAEHVRSALMAEHKAIFSQEDGAWNFDALEEWIGEEGMKALNRRAYAKWKQQKAGTQPPPAQQQTAPEPRQEARTRGSNFWKQLDAKIK